MIINDAGRKIVEDFETLQLTAYVCPAGKLTIGYGHTGDVRQGEVITEHQADVILESDLNTFETVVGMSAKGPNANQFSAMVALTFNIGADNFERSTLLRRFNEGAPLVAAQEFMRWTKAHVKGCPDQKTGHAHPGASCCEVVELPGLVKRRAAERALFLTAVS